MDQSSKRWKEVTPSEFDHERAGLELLAQSVPDKAPYYVFTNFTFQGDNGRRLEVDALVISPAQINLIELKSWSGHFTGNEHTWRSDWNGGSSRRNPLNATNYKAKLLSSRLETIFQRILREHPEYPDSYRDVPWVQESVFLHSQNLQTSFTAQGMQNVFGIDGHSDRTGLPGISDRITEKPRRFRSPVDEKFVERMLLPAITEITGYRTRRAHAGPWLLTKHVDDEEDRQVWEAVNARGAQAKTGKQDRAVVRVSDIPRGADRLTANRLYSHARREYELLKELSHPGIEAPFAFEVADTPGSGEAPALIYRPSDGFEPLDLLYPGMVLTAAQQVELISQVADAVAYAHANNVVHRHLTPSAVLLNTRLLDTEDPRQSTIQVKVSQWTAVTESVQSTRLRSALAAAGTGTGTTGMGTSVSTSFDEAAGFLPPEGFDGDVDRTKGDLFSIGALSYFVFSGGQQPATSRAELNRVLSRAGGLDLDATGAQVEDRLRDLVLGVTTPSPAERLASVQESSRRPLVPSPVKLFLKKLQQSAGDRITDEGDALHPKVGENLADRFTMVKQLGAGSTALGLLVHDTEVGEDRVLKVARDESKVADLEHEAESLAELAVKLEGSPQKKHFVELLEPTLHLPFDRTALLLSFGGEFTLADQLQMGPLNYDQFWKHGDQLLNLLVALEKTGLTHRDIKPANLGLRGKPSAKTLVLFDFSLTHRELTATDLGTRPYLDPFLSKDAVPSRPHFDGYAERYSALVVLLQMATADYPRYGEDDGTAVELTDGHLALTPEDFPETWPVAQRDALTELFQTNLDRDVRHRTGSAQELLEVFRSIRRKGASAAEASMPTRAVGTEPATQTTSRQEAPEALTLQSLKDLCEELVAYSGDKNTHERRLVSNILGVVDKAPSDPFVPLSVFAEVLDTSPGKMPRLTAAIGPLWQATPALQQALTYLQQKLTTVLRALGGIGTPDDLRPVVEDLFPSPAPAVPTPGDVPAQNIRRQLGVLRLMEMALSRRADGDGRLHLIRRQGVDAADADARVVALTDDPALTGLPAVLSQRAHALLEAAPHELVDSSSLTAALTAEAADYLEASAAELPVLPSMLARLTVGADGGLALTSTGDLYPVDMSTESLVRAVFPVASMKVPRDMLSNKVQRRFPDAVNRRLPSHPALTDIVTSLVPDMVYDTAKKAFLRPVRSAGTDELQTLHTRTFGQTIGLSDRPRADLEEPDRKLLDSLESTLRDRYFRVIQVSTGRVSRTVNLLTTHLGARHVDIGEAVLNELWHLFEETNQTDKFEIFLEADAPDHPLHPQLAQLVRLSAQKSLTNELNKADGGLPVVLSHPSILASFNCLDLLATWSQIGADNTAPVWLVTTDDAPSPTNAHAVDGVQLPLSSPDQVLSYQ